MLIFPEIFQLKVYCIADGNWGICNEWYLYLKFLGLVSKLFSNFHIQFLKTFMLSLDTESQIISLYLSIFLLSIIQVDIALKTICHVLWLIHTYLKVNISDLFNAIFWNTIFIYYVRLLLRHSMALQGVTCSMWNEHETIALSSLSC